MVRLLQYENSEEIECTNADDNYLKNGVFKKCVEVRYCKAETGCAQKVQLNFKQYVGTVKLETQQCDILPRFNEQLIPLLKYLKYVESNDFVFDENRHVKMERGTCFFDILGFIFCNQLRDVMDNGLLKRYITDEDNMSYLKGKLLFKKHLKNNLIRQNHFYCSYDDLTFDNMENQITLYALSSIIRLVSSKNKKLQNDLHYYLTQIQDEITYRVIEPHELKCVISDRINEHYTELLRTCKIVIESVYYKSISPEESVGCSFLVDMNKIFQQAVTGILQEIIATEYPEYELRSEQQLRSLVKEGGIIVRPDILIKGPNTTLVIDTKYKRQDLSSDYYQIIAYVIALKEKCQKGCLIYPSISESQGKTFTLYTSLDNKLNASDEKHLFTTYLNVASNDDYINHLRNQLRTLLKQLID